MLFQILDDKTECVGIYTDQKLYFDPDEFPTDLTATWSYAPSISATNVDYACLYLEGSPVAENIPEYLKDDWEDVSNKIKAFKNSLTLAKVNMEENCFFDLVPTRFLADWCEVKNKITEHVLHNIKRPQRYDFYKHVSVMLGDIATQKVDIDRRYVSSYLKHPKLSSHAKKLLESDKRVIYNQFGTKTGRLTTKPTSFPILTLPQSLRKAVKPQNDIYVEIDFNGAEVRTLLGLLGKEQPLEDIHEFHLTNVFKTLTTRAEAKGSFFAWLYGSKKATNMKQSNKLDEFYHKAVILDKFFKDSTVKTLFGKKIENVSQHHALNYIIQSTTAELCLKQFLKVNFLLSQHTKSHVAFLIHDSIVLDMRREDLKTIDNILKLMRSTNFGQFAVNIKKGKNLGEMIPWIK